MKKGNGNRQHAITNSSIKIPACVSSTKLKQTMKGSSEPIYAHFRLSKSIWMIKLGKLFQNQLFEIGSCLADSTWLMFARVASSKSYMRCSEVINKIDPQVFMIHTVK